MQKENYPQEFFIKIENEPCFEGRITLFMQKKSFQAEIDIVQKESKKIWKHVGIVYNVISHEEALHSAVQQLAFFLKGKKI